MLKHSDSRVPPKMNLARMFPVQIAITRAELARLGVIASQHRVSQWRAMRLALELLFAEQSRAAVHPPQPSATSLGDPRNDSERGARS